MPKGIFVGLSTIDVLYYVDSLPSFDSKVVARSQTVLVGGPATNAAIAFSHLGGAAILVTTIGRHPLAQLVADDLDQFPIKYVDLDPQFDKAPVLSSIVVSAKGHRSVVSANATRSPNLKPNVNPVALENTSIMLVDGHYMNSGIAWAREARDRRITVVFDGGSWKPDTQQLLKSVDVAICSSDFRPPGCQSDDEVVDFLTSCGVRRLAITKGEAAIRYFADDNEGEINVPNVAVVDTLGAGDIFHGAFCRFYEGKDTFLIALQKAAIVASQSVGYPGTREWMKHTTRDGSHSG
jgi:sugar/nucleoside kinase (ribokinase family)